MKPSIPVTYACALGIAVLIGIGIGHCEEREHTHVLLSPIYSPAQSTLWNASKAAGYLAGGLDAHSTTQGLRRGGCYESNMLDNIFINRRDPALVKRQAVALSLQYGFNSLLDWGWRRSTTKKEKFALIAVRGGLTALSMWAWNHNRRLNANRN